MTEKKLFKKYPYTLNDLQQAAGLSKGSFLSWKSKTASQFADLTDGDVSDPTVPRGRRYNKAYLKRVIELRSNTKTYSKNRKTTTTGSGVTNLTTTRSTKTSANKVSFNVVVPRTQTRAFNVLATQFGWKTTKA